MGLALRSLTLFIAALTLSLSLEAQAATLEILNPALRTGEVLLLKFDEAPKGTNFNGKEIAIFPYQNSWRAVVPVALGTRGGTYKLIAEFANGRKTEKTVNVSAKSQKIINLPPPPKLGLTDKQIVKNLSISNTDLRKNVAEEAPITRFNSPFGLPLADNRRISSPFGELRQTGEESITHLGTDFDAAKGRAVAAINAGVVKNAYLDNIYGNSVIIDHGRGIYSLYLHLDKIKVKTGDSVKKGTLLGTVGDSGLANAPHLHLSIKINGVSVDPIQFVSVFR